MFHFLAMTTVIFCPIFLGNRSSIPRPQLAPDEIANSYAIRETGLETFESMLSPQSKSIVTTRHGIATGWWAQSIANQAEGTFQPIAMIRMTQSQFAFTGRIVESGLSCVYLANAGWDGIQPTWTFSLLHLGQEFGDLTAVQNVSDLNGCLAVYDYTHSRISYINASDGEITHFVGYDSNHLEMENVRGMVATVLPPDPNRGEPASIFFILQQDQVIDLPTPPSETSIGVFDDHGNGTVDSYFQY
ncbi:MAG: hypothetical protein DWQ01_06865 [Planctomycetota bacterium]|nr:MAG: hypothetical protein DWQ01_06865 [Planctomycetota bacterium]